MGGFGIDTRFSLLINLLFENFLIFGRNMAS